MKCDQKDFKSGSVSYGHEVVRPACFQVDWGLHPVLLLPPSVSPSLPWSSNSTTFKTLLYFNSSILSINTSRATILTHYHVSDSPSWNYSEYEEREYQYCTVSYRLLTLLPTQRLPLLHTYLYILLVTCYYDMNGITNSGQKSASFLSLLWRKEEALIS